MEGLAKLAFSLDDLEYLKDPEWKQLNSKAVRSYSDIVVEDARREQNRKKEMFEGTAKGALGVGLGGAGLVSGKFLADNHNMKSVGRGGLAGLAIGGLSGGLANAGLTKIRFDRNPENSEDLVAAQNRHRLNLDNMRTYEESKGYVVD